MRNQATKSGKEQKAVKEEGKKEKAKLTNKKKGLWHFGTKFDLIKLLISLNLYHK